MSVRAPLLLILGAAACTQPNPFFGFEPDANDDEDGASTGGSAPPAVGSTGGAGGSTGEGDVSSGVDLSAGDTCGAVCGDPDRDCLDGLACTGDLEWLWLGGDEYAQRATDVAVLSDGGLVVVGSFAGRLGDDQIFAQADVAAQESDAFVLRLDPAGQLVWLHAFGGPGRQRFTAVAALPGDTIAVAGQFDGSFDADPVVLQGLGAAPGVVGALTGDGSWLFVQGLAGAAVDVVDVAAGPGDTLTVAGNFSGPLTLGLDLLDGPDLDIFAARFDLTGALVWHRAVQAPDVQRVHDLAPTADGGLVLAGEFAGTLSIAGATLSAQASDGLLLALAADGQPSCMLMASTNVGFSGIWSFVMLPKISKRGQWHSRNCRQPR
jgi:hypothetical protein